MKYDIMNENDKEIGTSIYDLYGVMNADIKVAVAWIAEAAEEVFTLHYSDERGEYYLSADWPHRELTVEPNELEDEDGKYLQQPEHAEYPVLFFASHNLNGERDTSPYLDEMRDKLRGVEGVTFLQRRVSQRPTPPKLSLEEEVRILREDGYPPSPDDDQKR